MPGPLLTVTVAESVRRGFWAGPLLVAGHGVLEAALVAALTLGLGPVISRHGVVAGIALVGGGFLLWMGITIIADVFKGRVTLDLREGAAGATGRFRGDQAVDGSFLDNRRRWAVCRRSGQNFSGFTGGEKRVLPVSAPAGRLIGLGVAVSLSNPYWSLWWATIGISYVNIALRWGWPGVAVFYFGHILADLAWYTAVGSAVAGGRHFLSLRLYRGILAVAGLFLVGLAGYFILAGLRFWWFPRG